MCTVTAMDKVRKAYDKYRYFSDCFDFRTDVRLEKMIYLVKGSDELSNHIASEIRGKHSFYSTYTLEMNLCAEPTTEQVQNFISQVKSLNLQGQGMLIANKQYYSQLIEEYPSFIHMFSLIRPDYDKDYIQLMVDFQIGRHYASRVKVLKEKNVAKEGIAAYYKHIMPFDVMVLPSVECLSGLVSAAYIYQEIKLRHNITPKVYVQCSGEVCEEKELSGKLLNALCVENVKYIDNTDEQTMSKVVSNYRVLFITPQRCSLKKHRDVEELQKEIKISPCIYVVEENLDELLNKPVNLDLAESWQVRILKDIKTNLDVAEQSDEVLALQESLKQNLASLSLAQSYTAHAGLDTQIEELIEKHQAYLKHLFKI